MRDKCCNGHILNTLTRPLFWLHTGGTRVGGYQQRLRSDGYAGVRVLLLHHSHIWGLAAICRL